MHTNYGEHRQSPNLPPTLTQYTRGTVGECLSQLSNIQAPELPGDLPLLPEDDVISSLLTDSYVPHKYAIKGRREPGRKGGGVGLYFYQTLALLADGFQGENCEMGGLERCILLCALVS